MPWRRTVWLSTSVLGGVLLGPEGGSGHEASGIVDGAHQGEQRTPSLEPVVAAPVDLEQQPRAGHPFTPAAVALRPPAAHRGEARLGQDPPERAGRQHEADLAGQRPGQVDRVEAGIGVRGELDDGRTERPISVAIALTVSSPSAGCVRSQARC